jgi:tRNA(Ile)-lysidine synthase
VLTVVRDFVQRYDLLRPGETVVVGVSGGPDSLCLLHVLLRLREEMDVCLHVAHLHHGARAEAADADADFVNDVAQRWHLPLTVVRRDIPAIAQQHGLAFEETARRVRYAFLSHVAGEVGASKVAVGHNADDQAETVLMHFLRGAGPAGLRGMLPATPLSHYRLLTRISDFSLPDPMPALVRPLLSIPRVEIEKYCKEHDLHPRFDRSNLDRTYFRNRLRHELLPLLETYNPNVRRRLRHTAQVVAADYELLEQLRREAWDEVARSVSEAAVIFDLDRWRAQPLSIRRALIRRAAYRLRPHLRDVEFVHVENAARLAQEGETGTQATLPGGLFLTVGYEQLTLAGSDYALPVDGPALASGQEVSIVLPGVTSLPDGEWRLRAAFPSSWTLDEIAANPDRWVAYMDADALEGPLVLRPRRSGERFRPHGLGGHAPRLTDWMINAKIPRSWRERLPLLIANGEIVWICGWRLSESVVVKPATERVVRFAIERIE